MDLTRSRHAWPWFLLAGVLALGWLALRPGLAGGFLFDDFVNLPVLGAGGPIDNADAFWRYVTSGSADPTGRPVSLLSFLLDARDWPADPRPFLRTNILLHLLNGALLFLLLRMLERRMGSTPVRGNAGAVLAAALWTLHPLFVSTTLYIVQREAMLPTTFTLLGLLAWIQGRQRFADNRGVGSLWMIAAFGACTVLATASKANGVLLPLLAWVIDAVVLRPQDSPEARDSRWLRVLRGALLIVPSLVALALVALELRYLGEPYAGRSWTLEQRLLTEPRVLMDYLQLLVVPRVLSTGLYNDAYVVSTGLLQPLATLPSLLAIVGLAAAGFGLRRKTPALAAALLFFLAGHLLESTTIPLELYFEHRNYLPAMLLGWPLARAIVRWKVPLGVRMGVSVALVLLLTFITWQRATLWSQQAHMAYLWAAQNPASSRAQATAAMFETQSGRPDLAVARLEAGVRAHPDDLQLVLNRASAVCAADGLSERDITAVETALRTAKEGDQLVHRWLGNALADAQTHGCRGLDVNVIARWLHAAQSNPRLRESAGRQQDLHSVAGRLAIARGTPGQALVEFDLALKAYPTPQAAMQQAAMLATHGCYRNALAHLDHFERMRQNRNQETRWSMQRVHHALLDAKDYWPREFARLRNTIENDLRQGEPACRQ